MNFKLLLLLLFIFIFSGCSFFDSDFDSTGNTKINIYLVKEGQLTYDQTKVDLSELEFEKTPWLKYNEIDFYDWSAHIFYLKKETKKQPFSGRYF